MKMIIIGGVVCILAATVYIGVSVSSGVSHNKMTKSFGAVKAGGVVEQSNIRSVESVSVAVTESAEIAAPLRDLLKKRLSEIGFLVSSGAGFESAEARASDKATVVMREESPELVSLLERLVFSSGVFRREINPDIPADVLIVQWSIDDIQWGAHADEAAAIKPAAPAALDRASVAVRVLNASGKAGEAGRIAGLLRDAEFSQVEAANAENEAPAVTTVYYSAEREPLAKEIADIVRSAGYASAVLEVQATENESITVVLVATQ